MNRHGSAYSGAGSVSVHSYLKPMTSSRHLTEKLYQAAACISQHRLGEGGWFHACTLDAGNKGTKRKTGEAMRKSFNLDLG